jgi:hypothetical protein
MSTQKSDKSDMFGRVAIASLAILFSLPACGAMPDAAEDLSGERDPLHASEPPSSDTSSPVLPSELPVTNQASRFGETITLSARKRLDGGVGLAAGPSIVCNINVQNPHNSTHVPGTVNVVSTVSCTGAVTRIYEEVGLYLNGNIVSRAPFSVVGSAYLSGNSATPCNPGTYQGAAAVKVTWPPGFNPPETVRTFFGNSVPIACQ